MRRLLLLLLAALALLPSAALAAAGPEQPALKPKGDFSPLGDEKLSNERTVSRWGHDNLLGGIRAKPSMAAKAIWRSPIGVGAPGTPTPGGRFWIRERLRNLGGSPVYGPWAFGTVAYSRLSDWPGGGVVGIHGTNEPGLIPGRPSHGCVRVPNARIARLAPIMPVGTPVRIT